MSKFSKESRFKDPGAKENLPGPDAYSVHLIDHNAGKISTTIKSRIDATVHDGSPGPSQYNPSEYDTRIHTSIQGRGRGKTLEPGPNSGNSTPRTRSRSPEKNKRVFVVDLRLDAAGGGSGGDIGNGVNGSPGVTSTSASSNWDQEHETGNGIFTSSSSSIGANNSGSGSVSKNQSFANKVLGDRSQSNFPQSAHPNKNVGLGLGIGADIPLSDLDPWGLEPFADHDPHRDSTSSTEELPFRVLRKSPVKVDEVANKNISRNKLNTNTNNSPGILTVHDQFNGHDHSNGATVNVVYPPQPAPEFTEIPIHGRPIPINPPYDPPCDPNENPDYLNLGPYPSSNRYYHIPSQRDLNLAPIVLVYSGILVGLLCTIMGLLQAIMWNPGQCIFAGVFQMIFGIWTIMLEALQISPNKVSTDSRLFQVIRFINGQPFYTKSAIYILVSILPISLCWTWATGVGAGSTLILGLIYLIFTLFSRD